MYIYKHAHLLIMSMGWRLWWGDMHARAHAHIDQET